MHELAITQSLLAVALESARGAGAERIKTIRLQVGALTGVVPDSVRFYLDAIARDTLAEGARLEVTVLPATASCGQCDLAYPTADGSLVCPSCGSLGRLTQGTELRLESLEVDP